MHYADGLVRSLVTLVETHCCFDPRLSKNSLDPKHLMHIRSVVLQDGNPNAKARNISAGSLPSLLPQQAIIPPGLEEFSESARGLAGLDCYEKFGKQMHSAPSLQDWEDEVLVGRARVAQEVQQDEDDQALASCLATPYAADVSPSLICNSPTHQLQSYSTTECMLC